jgi:transposase InsO family protein
MQLMLRSPATGLRPEHGFEYHQPPPWGGNVLLEHRFTRSYTPRTNGKADRFIQTALREWAYARSYQNSNQRNQELRLWLHQYNWRRPHASLGLSPPISRAGIDQNNLLRLHTARSLSSVRAAKDAVIDWILWYDRKRMHSTIGYQSPVEFEQTWLQARLEAA